MSPTLRDGDVALVAKRGRSLSRGRIAVVRADAAAGAAGGMVQVKRVVGLPGERVELREGSLFIDEAHRPEPYLGGLPANVGLDRAEWRLGAGEYFVMGDNRARSVDSRRYGPVGEDAVLGVLAARIWPPRLSAGAAAAKGGGGRRRRR